MKKWHFARLYRFPVFFNYKSPKAIYEKPEPGVSVVFSISA